jgi:hypothetical protein
LKAYALEQRGNLGSETASGVLRRGGQNRKDLTEASDTTTD